MEIRFNVTGARRKELVNAISQIVGWEPVYQGAPTFAYAVADFLIDKDGTLTGSDISADLLDALALNGFTSEFAVTDEEAVETAEQIDSERQHGIETWSEHATPENAPITPGTPSDDVGANLPTRTDSGDTLAIEMPVDCFTEVTLANLEKLIESKAALIKNALGVDSLPIERTEMAVAFPWFAADLPQEELDAYTRFIAALCKMAKEQTRITAKAKDVENEKYAFRCFLLRLGFIGKDYSAVRKILLKRLSGNGSFKSGERKPPVAVPAAQNGGAGTVGTEAVGDE